MLTIRTLGKFQIRDEEHIVNEERDTVSQNDKSAGLSDYSQKSDTDFL